jgi:hypothetical protein
MISILMIPLVMNLNISFLQTQTDAKYEQASSESESITRIIRRMLSESSSKGFEISDLTTLAEDLEDQFPQTTILVVTDTEPDAELPVEIIITSTSGVGNSSREKVTHLPILVLPPRHSGGNEGGGGESSPTENSTGTEFYHTSAVVMNNSSFNNIFFVCGNPADVEQPSEKFYDNNTDKEQFQEDFSNFINYYTGANFTKRYDVGLLIFEQVTPLTQPEREIIAPNGSIAGVTGYAGNVRVKHTYNWFNITSPNGSANAIEAYGNLTFPEHIGGNKSVVDGNIRIGGKLSTSGIQELTINGNLYVKGNLDLSSYTTKLTVTGDVIVGGDITLNLANLDVGGSVLSGGSIDFTNTATLVEIDGDVIAQNNVTFNAITTVRVGGTVAANGNVLFTNTIANVSISGDLLAMEKISFESINTTFLVGGIIGSYNDISFNNGINTNSSKIGGFYAGGTTFFEHWIPNNKICIEYAKPSTGTNTKIEFGV